MFPWNEKVREMSKSNYEKYATVKQQELLHKERTLSQAISCLRDRKRFSSLQSIDMTVADKKVCANCISCVFAGIEKQIWMI